MSSPAHSTLLIAASFGIALAATANGENDYTRTCSACHNLGVAGAPKLGDTEAWSERVTKDKEELYRHAIKGFAGDEGVMPPKGGFSNLTDDQVKAIVDYMVSKAE
ncbi:MAG: c-type cytochrome [Gammaproteobacteria bacterium]